MGSQMQWVYSENVSEIQRRPAVTMMIAISRSGSGSPLAVAVTATTLSTRTGQPIWRFRFPAQ